MHGRTALVWVNEQAEGKEAALFAMGTYIRMAAYGENAETALQESSNRVPSGQELSELLQKVGYQNVRMEDGMLSLAEGVQIDLGAVGKGYTGDIVASLLKERGVTSVLLDIGGNIHMVGSRPDGSKWTLGIRNPFADGRVGVLEAEECAVVTSGGYERYFIGEDGERYWHILDPKTGYPAESGLASVTIISKEGRLCDVLSTAVYVMGLENAEEYWKENGGLEMLLVTEENEIYLTEGLEGDFTLHEDLSDMKIHVLTR